jgi:hypothetical protein
MTNKEPLFSLEHTDLHTLLMPSWVKESSQIPCYNQQYEDQKKYGERSSKNISQGRRNHDQKSRSFASKREVKGNSPSPSVVFHGWKIEFIPEQRGLDEIAKQIRSEGKAYPLFELARLILQKPERYHLRFLKLPSTTNASRIYQCLLDEGLWLSEKELIAHVLKKYRDRYYQVEKIEVEPPKGSYTSLAVCGMSQTILGPSNHHEYQAKVRQLHSERFSHLPFEVFKSRITMVRDEAMMEQWKKDQSLQEIFTPCTSSEVREEEKIIGYTQVEDHFKKEYASSIIKEISEEILLPATAGTSLSDNSIKSAIQQALQELRRFPLPLSHLLGQELTHRGLQIFKAHENIVYISVARPRSLSQETPLSPSLIALIKAIESHQKSPRAEQWQVMLQSRPRNNDETQEQHESAIAKDLSWLIHEGYILNYALRGFAVAKKG